MLYLLGYIVLFAILALAANFFAVPPAAQEAAKTAAEPSAFTLWWNYGWKIINFLILAFLIVKMAKEPMKEFLKKQRETAAEDLAKMEERKKEAKAEQERITQMTAGLAKELAAFETALSETAAKEREELLETAKSESKLILERAEVWAEQALGDARQKLAAEMLEQAAEIASETIQRNITDQDRQHFFEEFNSGLKEAATL
jgi:F-type H+-transporting ATPase subunit b